MTINQPDQVWCADITYIPLARGFMYLVVVMDWHSRKVLSWRISNTGFLKKNGIRISMDGRGRFHDNIFIERLWWTLKYHYLYLNAFNNGIELRQGLKSWFEYYNQERFHQSLEDWTPDEIYFKKQEVGRAA